jgi:hypothetical protein
VPGQRGQFVDHSIGPDPSDGRLHRRGIQCVGDDCDGGVFTTLSGPPGSTTSVAYGIIRQLILNPHTGAPVSKVTLNKHFKRQLAAGGVMLKELAASKYFEALKAGESWAIAAHAR